MNLYNILILKNPKQRRVREKAEAFEFKQGTKWIFGVLSMELEKYKAYVNVY